MQSFKELCIQAMILMAGHENNMSLLERGFCQMKFIRKSGKILAFVKKQFTIERIQPRDTEEDKNYYILRIFIDSHRPN
jgi:hypothetical protein